MRMDLKLFRVRHKLTQSEIAAKIGVSRQVYSNIEKGRNGGSTEFWGNLQRAFNIRDEDMYSLMKLDGENDSFCYQN